MTRLRKLLALPAGERRLLLAALALLWAVRVALWLLPFRSLYRRAQAMGRERRAGGAGRPALERILWAVAAADRLVPWTTCLVRAMAAQVLLGRSGYATELRLGVAGGGGRAFEAHAWLEQAGRVLVGGPVDGRYVALPSLEHLSGRGRPGG